MNNIKNSVRNIIRRILQRLIAFVLRESRDWEDRALILAARTLMQAETWRSNFHPLNLKEKEFRVYSQFGDDGIIQFLISVLDLKSNSFIEFGVADFFESNSHFLLVNNNWHGFVIDGSADNIRMLRDSDMYWRYSLQAEVAFVNSDNVMDLLGRSGFGKIGLLHIDIDGNDYWILKALDLSVYQPDILVLEYNANFGDQRAITVPYEPLFDRLSAHSSGQYFGASLPALNRLAEAHGYYFIGCNAAGNNAYFLHNIHQRIIRPVSLSDGFVDAQFRDARDSKGRLVFWSRDRCKEAIRGMPVVNVLTGVVELL